MKQMSFCEDDCEISSTFACSSAVVENVRPTTSGTPTIPGPPTVMSATSRIAVSALTPPPLLRPCGVIFVPDALGREAVADPHGNACLFHGTQRFRMQHLGAEIGELGRFAVGNFGNRARLGHEARIGGEHAVHVRPDDDFIGIERRAQDRRGIVGAAAAERGENAVGGRADEAGRPRESRRDRASGAAASRKDSACGP